MDNKEIIIRRKENCIYAGGLSGEDFDGKTIQPTIQVAIFEIVNILSINSLVASYEFIVFV